MRTLNLRCASLPLAVLVLAGVAGESRRSEIARAYGRLPLSFEAGRGPAEFLARGSGYTVRLSATEAVLKLGGRQDPATVRMKLAGANPGATARRLEALPGKTSYFLGRDPASWRTRIPTFRKVGYKDVYPGIDLVYYGNQKQLEYDFDLAPGADPRAIRLAFEGARSLQLDSEGGLLLNTDAGPLRHRRPAIYQEVAGVRRDVAGRYVLTSEREVGFDVDEYDTSLPLVIDPVLVYSTYLGDVYDDRGTGIAADKDGNAYVAGWTDSTEDRKAKIFLAKFNPSGTEMIYVVTLGGSEDDRGYGIAIDADGQACVTGLTYSGDFPLVNAFRQRLDGFSGAFAAKINSAGDALIYSTYLGAVEGKAIAVDSAGMVYVTGVARQELPVTANALQRVHGGSDDAFVMKIDPSREGAASLVYSTFLGGSLLDTGAGIAVDKAGNAYVTGQTISADFPTLNPIQKRSPDAPDAFVAKIDAQGSALLYSTYLASPNWDEGKGIAVDDAGNAYVVGMTNSKAFPTTPGAFQTENGGGFCDVNTSALRSCFDAFVVKLNAPGTAMVYSTLLGGPLDQEGRAIAVDWAGNAYVTGKIRGPGGLSSISMLNASGSEVLFSGFDEYAKGNGIAVDKDGNLYVTGETRDPIPLANAIQDQFGGGLNDGFVVKISP